MSREPQTLGEFEQQVLLAVLRLSQAGEEPYGIPVHHELVTRTNRRVARGAVYMTLDRLERKGLLRSYQTAPTAERGGRARRCYEATKPAVAALRASQRALRSLGDGLELGAGK